MLSSWKLLPWGARCLVCHCSEHLESSHLGNFLQTLGTYWGGNWFFVSRQKLWDQTKYSLRHRSKEIRNVYKDFPGGLVVKTLPSNAEGAGSVPGWGSEIPCACDQKTKTEKQEQYCNKLNKDFKNGLHKKKKLSKKQMLRKWKAGKPDMLLSVRLQRVGLSDQTRTK